MKNRLLYILIVFLVSFSFMTYVFADEEIEFEVYANASSTDLVVGSEVTVKVGIKSNVYIHACDFVVDSDTNVEFVKIEQMVGTFGAYKGEEKINVIDNGVSGVAPTDGINIMWLTYKVNGNGTLTIKTDSCTAWESEKEVTYKDVTINFTTKEKSEDYTLKNVKINGTGIPNFSSDGNSYPVNIDNPNFSLSWETTNPDFQNKVVVKMNGTVINEFDNIVWSDPTNQNSAELELIVDEKKIYKFIIIYEKKDLDNTLKSLKINGEEYFRVGETKYSIKVPSNVTSIRIEAVLNDSENFKLDDTFDNGVKVHSFSGNSTGFTIEVVPVNDQVGASSLSYIIEVTKEGSSSVPPSSSKPSSSKPVTGDVDKNPQTGDISMFLMALILISSLVTSVLLYQKNMEAYK